MVGLTRLFADDTSIEHSAYDVTTLVNLGNIDLDNILKWSNDWLVKFNPDKTDIVQFSTRTQIAGLHFKFDNSIIHPVDSHRHLGILFSSDWKWTKHIDILIERASKELNILRKLKFKLDSACLQRIYFTFIRPLLEYSCELWDNCGKLTPIESRRFN